MPASTRVQAGLRVLARTRWVHPLIGIGLATVSAGGLIWASGVAPWSAFSVLVGGALGDRHAIALTLARATPLLLAGVGVALARHCNLWNIGGEGQIYLGGLGAVLVALYVTGLPTPLHLGLAILVGGLMGGAWAAIAGVLRAWRNVNEVLTTLLMNYIAINLVVMLVEGPLRPADAVYARTERIPESAQLPRIFEGGALHAGIFLAIAAVIWLHIVLRKTRFGFEIQMTGLNLSASRHAGVRSRYVMALTLATSGVLAGIAGAGELMGSHRSLPADFSPGYGFDAIAVALMGLNRPTGIVPSALFFGALRAGAPAMERALGVDTSLVLATQGLAVFFVIVTMAVDWQRLANRYAPARQPTDELEAAR